MKEPHVEGVEISTTRGRNFSATLGLKAGYESDGEVFSRDSAIRHWRQWALVRFRDGRPFIGAHFGAVEDLLYGFEQEVDGEAKLEIYEEPVIRIWGEVASYQENLSDEEVIETLTSLFCYLANAFKQTTIRFLYAGELGSEFERCSYRLRMPKTRHPLD